MDCIVKNNKKNRNFTVIINVTLINLIKMWPHKKKKIKQSQLSRKIQNSRSSMAC